MSAPAATGNTQNIGLPLLFTCDQGTPLRLARVPVIRGPDLRGINTLGLVGVAPNHEKGQLIRPNLYVEKL
jgi:hypothetical protein